MSQDENNHVIVAIFTTEEGAEQASEGLKVWDEASDDIKLGAFGTLRMVDGELERDLGSSAGRGLLVWAVLAVIGAVLVGPLALLAGAIGGAVKSFFADSVELTEDEVRRIGKELDNGNVALVVACDDHEYLATAARLEAAGGEVQTYHVPEHVMAQAAEAFGAIES